MKYTGLPKALAVTAAVAALICFDAAAKPAQAITFELNTSFSAGSVDPAGPAPWLTATFEDFATNVVKLTLTAALVGGEFLGQDGFFFNVNPFILPDGTGITATYDSGQTASGFTYGSNCCHADGDGFFDAQLMFGKTQSPNVDHALSGTETSVYLLSGAGLTADSMFDLSLGSGNSPNGLYVAAHIQGTGPNAGDSAWITGSAVPIPPAALLFGSALAGMGFLARRRRKHEQVTA